MRLVETIVTMTGILVAMVIIFVTAGQNGESGGQQTGDILNGAAGSYATAVKALQGR